MNVTQAKTGNQTNCEVNTPLTLAVYNDTLYHIGLREGKFKNYRFSSPVNLYKIPMESQWK